MKKTMKCKSDKSISHNVIGYTTSKGVLLDLDKTSLIEVKGIAQKTNRIYKLEGYLIAKSSTYNYHIVFNRKMNWNKTLKIMANLALILQKPNYTKWLVMQIIKGASTLRISKKGKKPTPKVLLITGITDKIIKEYLELRELICQTNL